ncbi:MULTISPECIES: glycoside hydrolase family 43 protein [Flavobacteriaceae]|uniref:glycoside hydrolase family 43 protein n=1 Tax=Flavobacteriaceae TaxID=49546 RepID=UPI0014929A39|nr:MULTISPECIES: glycoside hydrolase family 43 protein [Allomuricauda]MDC6364768.1 glycoside hydrolase family 43 protein [Muricauda sp. AC10]
MKKYKALVWVLSILMVFASCKQNSKPEKQVVEKITYNNPILSGFYPDPSICKVGDDYYMVNSSFGYFPGLPIFESKDLVNWNQIGHVLDRNEQLDLTGQGTSRGLFAPAISYHNGVYYVVCTNVGYKGNFVVTTTDPKGPWSDPYWLPELSGIDPSIFFDEDGKSYIVFNSEAPNNEAMYYGHRTIKLVEFDIESLKVISEPKIIVNGGTDLSKEPIWIEGPHLYKKDGWYYLMCAEGGTEWNHSEVIFRSKSVNGPFESFENNPILTQRNLDKSRPNPIECTGHADLIEGPNGDWWAVFLATRPYEGKHFNLGRETFLAPVKWVDGWPIINPDYKEIQYTYTAPLSENKTIATMPLNGNFVLRHQFDDLHMSWVYLRNPNKDSYELESGKLKVALSPETVDGNGMTSFIAQRQKSDYGHVMTKMQFEPDAAGEQAGLLLYRNETHYYFMALEKNENGEQTLRLYQKNEDDKNLLKSVPIHTAEDELILKVDYKGNTMNFYYGNSEDALTPLITNVDATILSTETAGGFVGVMQALYATSNGSESANSALFDWFEIKTDNPVYKNLENEVE